MFIGMVNRPIFCRVGSIKLIFPFSCPETGSSPDPCRYDYAGTKAFSEPEAKVLSDFLTKNVRSARIQTYLSFHSYSQLLMFPYGATSTKATNYDHLKAIGQKAIDALRQRNNTVYQTGSVYETIYPSSGSSHDWAYSALNIPITFTFELRGLPNSTEMFILPAHEITPTGLETLDAVVAILTEAKKLGYYVPSNPWYPSSTASHTGLPLDPIPLLACLLIRFLPFTNLTILR